MIGIGAKLEVEQGSLFVEIENIKSLALPGWNVGDVPTSHLGLTDYARTFEPGMIDAGVSAVEAAYKSETYNLLTGLVRDTVNWRVSDPTDDSVVVTCDGYINKIDVAFNPEDGEPMISFQIKWTGLPEIA